MLGFGDWGVAAAYLACLAGTALCIYSALRHWNDKDAPSAPGRRGRDAEAEVEEGI